MALIGLAIAWLTKHFTFEVAKYVAFRALLILLILTLIPIAVFKSYYYILQWFLTYVSNYLGTIELQGVSLTVTGLGGWIVSRLRIGECIAILLSFELLSFTLRMIRVK